MLEIKTRDWCLWDEVNEEFITVPSTTLVLEHSLYTIDKWESIWHKPFLSKSQNDKSAEEIRSYLECMTVNKVDPIVYDVISEADLKKINDYISDPMTATTIQRPESKSKSVVTSEILYYDMIAFNIPFECQHWHLNKLLTLIEVCDIKNNPKKMTEQETLMSNKEINARNRARFHTKG